MGLAISQEILRDCQNNVIVVARDKVALQKLQDKFPTQVRILAGDLVDFSFAERAVNLAIDEFGRLDGLILNHGSLKPVVSIEKSDPVEWQRLFDVNFFSVVAFVKHAIPSLRKTNGSVIFTSSGASSGKMATWGAYGTSKAAVNGLAMTLAVEESEITSIAVRPGVVDTDMQLQLRQEHFGVMAKADVDRFSAMHQKGEMLSPGVPGRVMAKLVLDPPRELSGKYLRSALD